jgi:glycosyltransferase involved in cell wall biosynthesis
MKILHITSHMGGGVGTVIMGWMDRVIAANDHSHRLVCLDYANDKAKAWANRTGFYLTDNMGPYPRLLEHEIAEADIVLLHYWPHPMIKEFVSRKLPQCRLLIWSHYNSTYSPAEITYPDLWVDTSPVQGHGRHIWSTGGIDRFLKIQPKSHKGFNVGYVGWVDYRKMHENFIEMCKAINVPDVRFTIVGKNNIGGASGGRFTFTGLVDDVAPYLAEMDVFGYPLRPDHFGTSEQVLGEAMAAGVFPVVFDNPAEKIIFDSGIHTPGQYVSEIVSLYESKHHWATACKERAKKLYSLDTMISQWNAVFDEMMARPKTARYPL